MIYGPLKCRTSDIFVDSIDIFHSCIQISQEEDQGATNADMDIPVQLPTFINLPPPYSEQPSPLYNLCASSSISSSVAAAGPASTANFCDQHLMSVMSSTNSCYCHLQHHHHFCTSHSYFSSISESMHQVTDNEATKKIEHEQQEPKSSDTEQNTTDTESTSAFWFLDSTKYQWKWRLFKIL